MEKVFIIGHKNPDTDSVCSAIALANLRNQLGENAIPRVLGDLNAETEFPNFEETRGRKHPSTTKAIPKR